MNIKIRIVMASILGVLVGTSFWISDIIQKYSSRKVEEAIGMGALSAVGFFIGNTIDSMQWDKRKKWLAKFILIWFILLTSTFALMVLSYSDKSIWYTITITICFSIPLLLSNIRIK